MEGVSAEAASHRRAPRARQADRDLRRQPHHDRRRHRPRVQRGRRRRASRPTAGTCQRFDDTWTPRRPRPRSTPAHADPRPELIVLRTHIALRRAERAGHRQGARRAARRRGDPRHQARSAGPRTSTSWSRTTSREHMDRRDARRRGVARPGASASHAYRDAHPGPRGGVRARARRPAAGRLGAQRCRRSPPATKRMATRASSGKVLNAIAPAVPGARRRLGRPRAVERSPLIEGGGAVAAGRLRGPQPPLRHPRARHGLDPERAGAARRLPRLRRARS